MRIIFKRWFLTDLWINVVYWVHLIFYMVKNLMSNKANDFWITLKTVFYFFLVPTEFHEKS